MMMCRACNGTGLYVGIAEKDGVAVVCNRCKGTGNYEKIPNHNRSLRKNIKRVIQTNPGIACGEINGDITWVGGMTYEEWLSGKPFEPGMEMRSHTCPEWWYQNTDSRKKPNWDKCIGAGSFSRCCHFSKKDECWKKWDKQFGIGIKTEIIKPIPKRKVLIVKDDEE